MAEGMILYSTETVNLPPTKANSTIVLFSVNPTWKSNCILVITSLLKVICFIR